ncbi:MAG: lysylphosphatidylglycerol synthetase family protein [Phycisphaerales bacterium]|nr:lysylphosphatidylglycerol synthetase family protein [Phycisphaerales bacterium]
MLGLSLFVGLIAMGWSELSALDWLAVRDELLEVRWRFLLLAALAALLNVAGMGLYDAVCFPRAPRLGFAVRWGVGSVCFAWSNFLTFGPIGGPALRVLVYTRRGLRASSVARGLAAQYIGFTAGLIAWMAALALPIPLGRASMPMQVALAAGISVALTAIIRRAAIGLLRRREGGSQTAQALQSIHPVALGMVGFLDWGCSVTTLWLAALAAGVALEPLLAAGTFFSGHLAGMASMLPGGLGSADTAWLLALTGSGSQPDQAAAVILLFRLVFYVFPWVLAVLTTLSLAYTGPNEAMWRQPAVSGAVAVGAGFILLTAATPAAGERLTIWGGDAPLWLMEASVLTSIAAAALLAVLTHRLHASSRGAYHVSALLLAACSAAHIVKGADALEAIVCAVLLAMLILARRDFRPNPPRWPSARVAAWTLSASTALYLIVGLASQTGIRISIAELLRFARGAEWSRFLRGGLLLALMTFLVPGLLCLRRGGSGLPALPERRATPLP